MTTALIEGMKYDQAVAAVCDAAIEVQEASDAPVGFWTETGREKVLVGIARRYGPALVLEVDAAEWNGIRFLELFGVDLTPTRSPPPSRSPRRGTCAQR